MLGHQQHVFVFGQAQQASADQRAERQVERRPRLLGADPRDLAVARVAVESAEVVFGQGEADLGRRDELAGRAVAGDHPRAQALVAGDHAVQGRLQSLDVQAAAQAQRRGNVVGRARRLAELVEEPQPLLRER